MELGFIQKEKRHWRFIYVKTILSEILLCFSFDYVLFIDLGQNGKASSQNLLAKQLSIESQVKYW